MVNSVTLSSDSVLVSLRNVQDPDLKKDLVTLNMIRDLKVDSITGLVSFRVVLTTPACPLKAKIEGDCRAAVMAVAGVQKVEIKMDSEVKARHSSSGSASNKIEGVSHIIAVSSGKGGVGKSTVAVNLATALAMEGARVGLMDADVYGPNLPTMMGVTDQPKIQEDPIRGEVFIPPTVLGVKVMSMGFLIQGDQPVVWRGPMLHSVVNQFCHKVLWGELDYLIVDMPPGTGDVQLSLAQLVPVTGAVLVTTPQEVSMQDVRKAFHMFEKVRIPVIGIVENMSYFLCGQCETRHWVFGQDGGRVLAQKFHTQLLAQIPLVTQVREGGDEGRPIVARDPHSPVAEQLKDLARKVAQQTSILASQGVDPSQIVQIGKFN
jgi:ATP-binding protein involved in chromosome partitioning